MKTLYTLLSFFLFFSAQAQYIIDWANAPRNPIPTKYTLNHFNLVGPVKSQLENVAGFSVATYFDGKGRISYTGGTFGKMDYTYDTKELLVGRKNNNATFTYNILKLVT